MNLFVFPYKNHEWRSTMSRIVFALVLALVFLPELYGEERLNPTGAFPTRSCSRSSRARGSAPRSSWTSAQPRAAELGPSDSRP